ncbi:hypothetical protein [Aquisphaera insulae]|uniref:hypothetical protein n=1 Tax=Aquisphaera insulae TaxID=2712864 RepID=UPI0013EDB9C9|nr:hypothetical protein [Aquisphaera insulae]
MTTATRTRTKKTQARKSATHPKTHVENSLPTPSPSRVQEPLEHAQRANEAPEAREAHHEAPDAGCGFDHPEQDTIQGFRRKS